MNFGINKNLNRRDFLKCMGLSAAAGITSASCTRLGGTGTAGKKWQMRLSTSSIHFMQLPIEQACERIANLGFEAIDIWSAHNGCPHLDDVANRLGPEGLKKVLDKNNLELFAFSVYKGGYARYAELLGKAGGGVGALLNSLDSFKAFVDINTSPRLGIALAPYHLQTIKASVPEAIRICGEQLFFFYAWQNYPGAEQLPGIGPTDMTPWIRALADIRYRGYVNPFMHGHPEVDVMAANLAKSRDYLKTCYEKVIGVT